LFCTRQGSNLQPYDPKSYPTGLASSKVKTHQGLPEKITWESRASKKWGEIASRKATIAKESPKSQACPVFVRRALESAKFLFCKLKQVCRGSPKSSFYEDWLATCALADFSKRTNQSAFLLLNLALSLLWH